MGIDYLISAIVAIVLGGYLVHALVRAGVYKLM